MSDHATKILIEASDPRLLHVPDLDRAREILADYSPHDDTQAEAKKRMLAYLDEHPDAHERSCLAGHLTASALILDAGRERGLLGLHKKLGRWLQLGGHCDGDANLAGVALGEAIEESGIAGLRIDPRPIDLDIHTIPAIPGEPEHVHLDTRFLIEAPKGAEPRASEESLELGWFTLAELGGIETDDSVRRLFRLVLGG